MSSTSHLTEALITKFIYERKRQEKGLIKSYNAPVVVCGNKENDFRDDSFPPVADATVEKLNSCLFTQQRLMTGHLAFGNRFRNDNLEKLMQDYPNTF